MDLVQIDKRQELFEIMMEKLQKFLILIILN